MGTPEKEPEPKHIVQTIVMPQRAKPDQANPVRKAAYLAQETDEPNLTPPPAPAPPTTSATPKPAPAPATPPAPAPAPVPATESPTETRDTPEMERLPTPPPPPRERRLPAPGRATEDIASPVGTPLITLHVDNQPVGKVLEMVSRQAQNVNILVSPGVVGTVSLDLKDKTIEETLQIITRQCRLSMHRDGDVVFVSSLMEARQIEEDDLPVHVYHLNYVRSTDIQAMIQPLLSKKGIFTASPESQVGLPSDSLSLAASSAGSSQTLDGGGNYMAGGEIVVVQDYESVLKKVDAVIAQIDVQPIQVLIEAVIVSVRLEKDMELGVNFALLDAAGNAVGVAGSGAAINAAAGFTPASVLAAGGQLKGTNLTGTAQAPPGLKFGFVDNTSTGFIKALESWGETRVLATPRVLVLNKQRAEIHLGERLGFATATQTQTSTVQTIQFLNIGTQLRLRPFVSDDGMIRMEIHPERSSGALDAAGIPQVNAAQVTTNVIIPDGATIVIGGLIESEVHPRWSGIPYLSRLPWLGPLFRETRDEVRKRELVVILTPHIWRPEAPEALNTLGRPRSLGLNHRVAQPPRDEMRDAPSLYELTEPNLEPREIVVPDLMPEVSGEIVIPNP